MSEALDRNREICGIIDKFLRLKNEPVALKFVLPGEKIPDNAFKPKEDKNCHMAMCQTFALSRRNGKTVYMRREDHWCWNPLIGYGHVKCDERGDPGYEHICRTIGINDPVAAEEFVSSFMKMPLGKYEGVLTAPLGDADFVPDLWLIYCDNGQLRTMLRAVKSQTGKLLHSEFDPFDSCMYSVVPPILTGEYRITLPDPGEYERALTDDRNIIFSVPAAKFEECLAGVRQFTDMKLTNDNLYMDMKYDFARPPFYNEVFRSWGLDTGEDWELRK